MLEWLMAVIGMFGGMLALYNYLRRPALAVKTRVEHARSLETETEETVTEADLVFTIANYSFVAADDVEARYALIDWEAESDRSAIVEGRLEKIPLDTTRNRINVDGNEGHYIKFENDVVHGGQEIPVDSLLVLLEDGEYEVRYSVATGTDEFAGTIELSVDDGSVDSHTTISRRARVRAKALALARRLSTIVSLTR